MGDVRLVTIFATEPMQKLFVSVPEATELIGVSKNSIYRLIANGRLRSTKVGRRRLIMWKSVERLAETIGET